VNDLGENSQRRRTALPKAFCQRTARDWNLEAPVERGGTRHDLDVGVDFAQSLAEKRDAIFALVSWLKQKAVLDLGRVDQALTGIDQHQSADTGSGQVKQSNVLERGILADTDTNAGVEQLLLTAHADVRQRELPRVTLDLDVG
jgi:hypothetical protein